jgi:hypothetical protein
MRRAARVAAAGVALSVLSCAPMGARAPLVEGPVADAASRSGALEAARRGRYVWVVTCTDCHGAVDPRSVSEARLELVLPRMFRFADLDGGQQADLRAYVAAARGSGAP